MGVTHDARDNAIFYKTWSRSCYSCSINSIDTNEKESELISLDILRNV